MGKYRTDVEQRMKTVKTNNAVIEKVGNQTKNLMAITHSPLRDLSSIRGPVANQFVNGTTRLKASIEQPRGFVCEMPLSRGTMTFVRLSVNTVIPEPGKSLVEAYDKWRDMADEKVCCDFSLHICVTGWSDKVAEEMELLTKEKGMKRRSLQSLFIPDI